MPRENRCQERIDAKRFILRDSNMSYLVIIAYLDNIA